MDLFSFWKEDADKLRKPDTNKPVFRIFPEARESVKEGKCVTCNRDIKEEDFENALSRKEFSTSGMCQKCQNKVFGQYKEEEY